MSSKAAPECVDCQKGPSPPPADESSMQRCNDIYDKVDKCMKANRGQVSPCQDVWDAFRKCHDNSKKL